tara:strand:- start:15791 stop:16087 length:297 start_codon:yes stop_codon:yes gene_type:complete
MKNLNVKNMISANGNTIANQFIITMNYKKMFQSYDTLIAVKEWKQKDGLEYQQITLDKNSWDYSKTTGKYRNLFLGESKIETEKKIKTKEYKLKNLNK